MSIVSPYGFRQLKLRGVLAAVGGCMLWALSASSWSIGLGKIQLESHLNEPLRATIAIENSDGLRPTDVRATLAPKAMFDALGVAWSYNLDGLVVSIVSEKMGSVAVSSESIDLRVELTSVTAIVEPYLNFVIQFDWPNGRLVREYTLLLDPPALTVPGVSESSASELRNPLRPDRQSDSLTQELTQSKLGQASALTRSGDTLWEIALANRGDRRVSVQEMMLAIQSLNPEAFIDQNINRLKAGYRLVMPNDQDLQNYSAVEALAEVADQNRAQNIGIDEKKSPESTSPDAEPVLDGELVLVVAPDQPKSLPLQSPATGTELLKVEAMLTEAASVNEVLQGRLAALEAQLAEVTSAISAKDQQIATLQRQLRALAEAPESDNHSALLNPVTLGLVAALIVLVVVMLLMSARYQRLARAVRASPVNRQDEPLLVASEGAKVDSSDQPAERLAGGKESGVTAEETQVSEQIEAKDAANAEAVRGQALKQVNDSGAQGVLSESETAAPSSADEQARQEANPSGSTFSEDQNRLDLDELELLEVDMVDLDELEDAEELSQDSSELSSLDESMTASSEDESLFDGDEDPASMLDLARAYIDMGEPASARKLLARVQVIGVASEIEEAEKMLAGLSSS